MSSNSTTTLKPKLTKHLSVLLSPSKCHRVTPPDPWPSTQEIWKWTLTNDAIASCFVRDVYEMKENGGQEDFFWLKTVPCRNVRIVGMLVGLDVKEKRILYTIDDGTAVIDCFHKYKPTPPQRPTPIAGVGTSVRIMGKVNKWYETRQINVDLIERCNSPNDEPNHWLTVVSLHKSRYSYSSPFTIPTMCIPKTPTKMPQPHKHPPIPPTPSTAPSSPTKSTNDDSLTRLRHPSRLHSRQLTANTFMIYMKHYMDNARMEDPHSQTFEYLDADIPQFPSTPTRRPQHTSEHTPRPLGTWSLDRTPRLSDPRPHDEVKPDMMSGYTLSHLRRVPELSSLARRVVKAEAKRRAKEAKGKRDGVMPKAENEHSNAKIKRLFMWAVRKLREEGSIVLWDGPIRSAPISNRDGEGSSALWSGVGMLSSSISRVEDEDMELLDPQDGEESYVPLTPQYLAKHVEDVVKVLGGASKAEITRFLRRSDERWGRVGEWVVEEALGLLNDDGTIWNVGRGKWEVCL